MSYALIRQPAISTCTIVLYKNHTSLPSTKYYKYKTNPMDPPPQKKKPTSWCPPSRWVFKTIQTEFSLPSHPPPPFIQPLYNDAFTIYQFNKYMIDFRVQVRSLCQKKSMICDQKYRNSLYRGLINKAS